MNLNILLVDDHAIFLEGLESLLRSHEMYHIVAKTSSGQAALARIKMNEVDLMITDYAMPDMDGLELVKQARKLNTELKIVVLSMHDESILVKEMMSAGVNGYVLKKYAQQELINAIDSVANGRTYFSAEVSKAFLSVINNTESNHPSDRELEVLKLLAKGSTSSQIADELFISARTVETHRKNLMRKTGTNNVAGLLRYAYERKLI